MIPYLVPFEADPAQSQEITPAFPDWQKSFVSGPEKILFDLSHRISSADPHLLFTRVRFQKRAEGPPGHVHGGATAGLLDEVMGVVVWHHGFSCVTQSIQVHFKKGIPLEMEATLLTRITAIHEKTLEVHSTVFDSKKVPYVGAQGIFHRLTPSQLERFKTRA